MTKSLILHFLVCCTLSQLSRATYELDYLVDNCVADPASRVLYLGTGRSTYGIVRLTPYNDYVSNLNCALRIVAPAGYSLFVKIAWVDIHTTSLVCANNVDYLRVSSVNSYPPFDVYYCGHGVPDYTSLAASDGIADVRFVSGLDLSSGDAGFELHYNVYHTGGNCSINEWRCTDSMSDWCILEELVCDNRENCFDGADEWTCGLSSGGVLAVIIISSLIGGAIITFVVYIYYKRQNKNKTQRGQPRPAATGVGRTISSSSSSSTTVPTVQHTVPPPPLYTDPPPAYTFSSEYVNPYMHGTVTSPDDLDPVQVPSPLTTATITYPPTVPVPISRPPAYSELTAVENNTPSVV